GDVAAIEAVEVIHAESERVFVRGTFRDGDFVVVDGAHRIAPGQAVVPIPVGGDEPAISLAVFETK
ncbi:MAG: hypothetical protein AAFU55_13105, partial [Pseudomonadota bacterium]